MRDAPGFPHLHLKQVPETKINPGSDKPCTAKLHQRLQIKLVQLDSKVVPIILVPRSRQNVIKIVHESQKPRRASLSLAFENQLSKRWILPKPQRFLILIAGSLGNKMLKNSTEEILTLTSGIRKQKCFAGANLYAVFVKLLKDEALMERNGINAPCILDPLLLCLLIKGFSFGHTKKKYLLLFFYFCSQLIMLSR